MKPAYRYTLASLWLLFTTALTVWWYIFSQEQLGRLLAMTPSHPEEILRSKRMLELEGGVLIASLILGGIALLYHIYRDDRRNRELRQFFQTFAHELKTPIGSLRLQAECLKSDLRGTAHAELAERIVADTGRLNIQLENSLLLANLDSYQLHAEQIELADQLREIHHEWPELGLSVSKSCAVQADQRALQSILRNLIHNSVVHGKATDVTVTPVATTEGSVTIAVRDNGTGFSGTLDKLGSLLVRHYSGSGSGIGLFISQKLAQKMRGSLRFRSEGPGFEALLTLPGVAQ